MISGVDFLPCDATLVQSLKQRPEPVRMFVVNRNRSLQFVPLSCRAAAHQASHLLSPCLNKKTARWERLRDSWVLQLNLRRSDVALGWMPTSTATVPAAETLGWVARLHCDLTPSLPRVLRNSQAFRIQLPFPRSGRLRRVFASACSRRHCATW